MNILYISNRKPNRNTGPYYSIRNQVMHMSKNENVMWYNLNSSIDKYWVETGVYYNTNNFSQKNIRSLPHPFNKPDLIVFQGVYEYGISKIIFEVQKLKLNYIIIPRGSLNKEAQKRSSIKKKFANIMIYKKFIRNALAIQYLTVQEKVNSGKKWNPKTIIVPNGVSNSSKHNLKINNDIKGLYIGRLDIEHKGLDILLEAIYFNKDLIQKTQTKIDLYGTHPSQRNLVKLNKLMAEFNLSDVVKILPPVYGEVKNEKYLEYDFFILTSRTEGHPMGLIEALSYGLPVLITKGTNMYEEVKSYDAGWVSQTNANSLSTSLKNLITQKELFNYKSENAYRLSKNYLWDNITAYTIREYDKILKEKC